MHGNERVHDPVLALLALLSAVTLNDIATGLTLIYAAMRLYFLMADRGLIPWARKQPPRGDE